MGFPELPSSFLPRCMDRKVGVGAAVLGEDGWSEAGG